VPPDASARQGQPATAADSGPLEVLDAARIWWFVCASVRDRHHMSSGKQVGHTRLAERPCATDEEDAHGGHPSASACHSPAR
jgi:hypothetical protein